MIGSAHFVVVGTQRTGTTFLRTSLDSHTQIQCAGELFIGNKWPFQRTNQRYRSEDKLYETYMRENVKNWFVAFNPSLSVKQYLNWFYTTNNERAVGFKLMLSEARRFPSAIDYLNDHNVTIIHMVRLNVLRTYISRVMARRTGVYHKTELTRNTNPNVDPVYIETIDIINILDAISSEEIQIQSLFRHAVKYMKVVYESYIRNLSKHNGEIASFLGCESEPLNSPLKKLHDYPIATLVENYDELERRLIKTRFEYCLE